MSLRESSTRTVLLLEKNDEWQVSRRYLSLESLAPVMEKAPTQPVMNQLNHEEAA
ncbi:MAG: hypothetical protein JJT90_08680 [Ectothiorhodospiraceae bacterium]|nr:hypothetical protein [Ectothiorhodospiraceae bacterium]